MENAIIAQNIKRYFKAGDGTTCLLYTSDAADE